MRIPRIYHSTLLSDHSEIVLNDDAVKHVSLVLRMKKGQLLHLFDGSNRLFTAEIIRLDKKKVFVRVDAGCVEDRESPLHLHLGQVISRGERMELTIQKSVELGVNVLTPLFSERCSIKLSEERLEKKNQQWRKIAIAACEQCGRNVIPEIRAAMSLSDWCQQQDDSLKLTLDPQAKKQMNTLPLSVDKIRLLIGSEGGLSADEIDMTFNNGFEGIRMGPRIFRTETAAIAAITALQLQFGDLGRGKK